MSAWTGAALHAAHGLPWPKTEKCLVGDYRDNRAGFVAGYVGIHLISIAVVAAKTKCKPRVSLFRRRGLSNNCHHALRIVVAAASEATRLQIEKALLSVGHAVQGVDKIEDATRAVQDAACDLLIVEHQEPALDGSFLTRKIRRMPGALKHLPIVMIAERFDPLVSAVSYRSGVTAFFPKPESGPNLSALLDQLCLCIQLSKMAERTDPALAVGVDGIQRIH